MQATRKRQEFIDQIHKLNHIISKTSNREDMLKDVEDELMQMKEEKKEQLQQVREAKKELKQKEIEKIENTMRRLEEKNNLHRNLKNQQLSRIEYMKEYEYLHKNDQLENLNRKCCLDKEKSMLLVYMLLTKHQRFKQIKTQMHTRERSPLSKTLYNP